MKKLTALMLTITMLFSMIPTAHAAKTNISGGLEAQSFLEIRNEDDEVESVQWKEFDNNSVGEVILLPGENYWTPIFHSNDWSHLSYENERVVSSNPAVATAEVVHTATTTNGLACDGMMLSITGHLTGSTVITVTYDTIVNRSDVEDERSATERTKTFNVTVSQSLLMADIALNTNQIIWDYSLDYLEAKAAYQKAAEDQALSLSHKMMTGGAAMAGSVVAGGLTVAALVALGITTGPALAMAGGMLSLSVALAVSVQMAGTNRDGQVASYDPVNEVLGDKAKDYLNKNMGLPTKISHLFGEGASTVDTTMDMLKTLEEMSKLDQKYAQRFLPYPTYSPTQVWMKIRLTNLGMQPSTNVVLRIGSSSLSLTSNLGPYQDERTYQIAYIAPGQTVEIPVTYNVYPNKRYAHEGAPGEQRLLYQGVLTVTGTYVDQTSGERVSFSKGVGLPVYSRLGMADAQAIAPVMNAYPDLRATYVMCPVDVMVLDAKGETVATLTTGGEGVTTEDVICGVDGDAKYVLLPRDKVQDYQLRIVAVDDGEMDIVGMDTGDTLNSVAYESIPLKKGDTFELSLTEAIPAQLYALAQDGRKEAVEPALVLNQDSIAEQLKNSDVSEEARLTVAQAITHGLMPVGAQGSYQEQMTLEDFCAMLVNFYELRLNMFPGEMKERFLTESGMEQTGNAAISTAVWAGLLDSAWYDKSLQADAAALTISGEEAAAALNTCMQLLYQQEYTAEILRQQDGFSREQLLCELVSMWKQSEYCALIQGKVPAMQDQCAEGMRIVVGANYPAVFYFRENEMQETLLRDFSLYEPAVQAVAFVSDDMETNLGIVSHYVDAQRALSEDFLSTNYPQAGTVDYKALKKQKQLTLRVGSLGADQFTIYDGWHYAWIPVYYETKDGSIYQDAVYLAILRSKNEADLDTLNSYNMPIAGKDRQEFTLIADQEQVSSFLAQACHMENQLNPVPEFVTLEVKAEGEAVAVLQQKLIDLGHLKGTASGVYDNATKKAVQAYQKSAGVKATGVADPTTQLMIMGYLAPADAALYAWLEPHIQRVERQASGNAAVTIELTGNGNIRKAPDAKAARVAYGKKGETYASLGVENGWYHIQLSDGAEGYVSESLARVAE